MKIRVFAIGKYVDGKVVIMDYLGKEGQDG